MTVTVCSIQRIIFLLCIIVIIVVTSVALAISTTLSIKSAKQLSNWYMLALRDSHLRALDAWVAQPQWLLTSIAQHVAVAAAAAANDHHHDLSYISGIKNTLQWPADGAVMAAKQAPSEADAAAAREEGYYRAMRGWTHFLDLAHTVLGRAPWLLAVAFNDSGFAESRIMDDAAKKQRLRFLIPYSFAANPDPSNKEKYATSYNEYHTLDRHSAANATPPLCYQTIERITSSLTPYNPIKHFWYNETIRLWRQNNHGYYQVIRWSNVFITEEPFKHLVVATIPLALPRGGRTCNGANNLPEVNEKSDVIFGVALVGYRASYLRTLLSQEIGSGVSLLISAKNTIVASNIEDYSFESRTVAVDYSIPKGDEDRCHKLSIHTDEGVCTSRDGDGVKEADCSGNHGTLKEVLLVCAHTIKTIPYQPLRDLQKARPNDMKEGTAKGALPVVTLDGSTYYYTVTIARTPGVVEFGWRLVHIIPHNDVFAEVRRGLLLALLFTSLAAILAALITALILSFLLRPLHNLSTRMLQAASLSDTDLKKMEKSNLGELNMIVVSFNHLCNELTKARAFLPKNVLVNSNENVEDEMIPISENNSELGALTPERLSIVPAASGVDTLEPAPHGAVSLRSASRASQNSSSHPSNYNVSIIRTLHTSSVLTQKRLSVVAINLVAYHATIRNHVVSRIKKEHEDLTEAIDSAARKNNGTLDSFQGDHYFLYFHFPNTHSINAVKAAKAIKENRALSEDISRSIYIGISSGNALIGILGTHDIRRNSIIGIVFSTAALLERLSRRYLRGCSASSILADLPTLRDVIMEYDVLFMDCIPLPSRAGRHVIGSVHGQKPKKGEWEGEWLYLLNSSYMNVNDAFEAFLIGDRARAEAELDNADKVDGPDVRKTKELLRTLLQNNTIDGRTYFNELSDFYATTLLGPEHPLNYLYGNDESNSIPQKKAGMSTIEVAVACNENYSHRGFISNNHDLFYMNNTSRYNNGSTLNNSGRNDPSSTARSSNNNTSNSPADNASAMKSGSQTYSPSSSNLLMNNSSGGTIGIPQAPRLARDGRAAPVADGRSSTILTDASSEYMSGT